ncbi:dTDP-4-dehydrorhamnose 3,5-epimerase family protein [bacterium]|nr:dTDP-4-dehydrorhamnose 3,5-epimerase family protein [bacterium]
MIDGIQIIPLKRIPDERGTIFHMMKATDPHFKKFGEIYFSTVYPGAVKGWHKHREMTLNYACIFGRVKVALYDDRARSPTKGEIQEVFLGIDCYNLLIIPPDVWNGFKGMVAPCAIIANCCTHPHDPSRSTRLDPYKNKIPYDWNRKDG